MVELSMRWTTEIEVEAEDEDMAAELAMDIADDELRNEMIDWDVDYVECLDEEEEELLKEEEK
jgi:hypothetical protein